VAHSFATRLSTDYTAPGNAVQSRQEFLRLVCPEWYKLQLVSMCLAIAASRSKIEQEHCQQQQQQQRRQQPQLPPPHHMQLLQELYASPLLALEEGGVQAGSFDAPWALEVSFAGRCGMRRVRQRAAAANKDTISDGTVNSASSSSSGSSSSSSSSSSSTSSSGSSSSNNNSSSSSSSSMPRDASVLLTVLEFTLLHPEDAAWLSQGLQVLCKLLQASNDAASEQEAAGANAPVKAVLGPVLLQLVPVAQAAEGADAAAVAAAEESGEDGGNALFTVNVGEALLDDWRKSCSVQVSWHCA
jgi:hypothetical protein